MTTTKREDRAEFWRRLGTSLAEGVVLVEAVRRAGKGSPLHVPDSAPERLALAVEGGKTFSEALLDFPDLFPSAVVAAVRAAEQSGTLDRAAPRIAEAVRTGDLDSLAGEEMPAVSAEAAAAADAVLDAAVEPRVTDVHLDPEEDGSGHLRVRVDGSLATREPVPADLLAGVIARLKTMAGLDVAERLRPQRGRILVQGRDRELDLRVQTAPTVRGERIVMRVLDPRQVGLRLSDILPDDEDRERIRSLARLPHGLVIVNGPTGSGKTTTLYCMLAEANRPEVSVVSLEDPVEYRLPGVVQMQVEPRFGFTFVEAHQAALRQDPDVMMIGEIRDLTQLVLAVRTAMTGHLVLTTLHARTSPEAVARMLHLGLEPFLLNASLTAVVSQLLIRKLCPDCREPEEPDLTLLPPDAAAVVERIDEPRFHARRGCAKCRHSGYMGRTAIHEILLMDEDVRRRVAETDDVAAIREAARGAGMKTFLECGVEKAARGVTSLEEILRVAPAPGATRASGPGAV